MASKKRNRKEKRKAKEASCAEASKSEAAHARYKKVKVSQQSARNPLLTQQAQFLDGLSNDEKTCFFSDEKVTPERRAEIWMEQADLGERLVRECAWATPDDRALRVLRHFSPLLEIGCGSNAYWCRMMVQAGIDVIGFDKDPVQGGKIPVNHQEKGESVTANHIPFTVRKGGPEVLQRSTYAKRSLFLCYPDEDVVEMEDMDDAGSAPQSLGAACLEHFQGDIVIHVGELFSDVSLAMEQAPWGRSSSPEFQQLLASEFHCMLHMRLPNWLHTRDSLSVWRRSKTCSIVFAAENEDDMDEEYHYRHVPPEEQLPLDRAAPCLAHLLQETLEAPPEDRRVETKETDRSRQTKMVTENENDDYSSPW